MKTRRKTSNILRLCMATALLVSLQACGGKDDGPATKEDGVITLDFARTMNMKDSKISLSELLEDFNYVQLDPEIETYADYPLDISDNYIFAKRQNSAVMLFDKASGRFIRNIGNVGNGPGEYGAYLSGFDVNEKHERVYILHQQEDILIYDIDGTYITKVSSVDGYYFKELFSDQETGVLTAFGSGEQGDIFLKYTPDGELITQKITETEKVTIRWENTLSTVTDSKNIYAYNRDMLNRDKTLRVYDTESMEQTPVLRVVNLGRPELSNVSDNSLMISIGSTDKYFWVQNSSTEMIQQDGKIVGYASRLTDIAFIDKTTLEVRKTMNVYNDYLLYDLEYSVMGHGKYFKTAADAITLINTLEETLEHLPEDADPDAVELVKQMLSDIDEEGNKVMLYGKYKLL